MTEKLKRYLSEIRVYWREARRVRDFTRVMRVRLSQSKLGPLVCPSPIVVDVDLQSLGRGVRLRSHTTDISVLGEILVAGSYRSASEALPASTAVIVDLGANIGIASRWLLERYQDAVVVSVEPEPENVRVLRHNLASYGSRSSVIAACVGATARRVNLATTVGEFGFRMSDLDDPDDEGDAVVVPMTAVLERAGGMSVDFLKCDIEGAEQELFGDCAQWIRAIRLMSVECHLPFGAKQALDLLERNGVTAEVIELDSTPQFGCETLLVHLSSPPG